MPKVYVDGAHGTVGGEFLNAVTPLIEQNIVGEVAHLSDSKRKDVASRMAAMAEADVVVLCLPDDAAIEAAKLALSVKPSIRILDASAAHRCDSRWAYGFTEIIDPKDFPDSARFGNFHNPVELRNAQLVANPGCFATGCILIAQVLTLFKEPNELRMVFNGITGYSAAGNKGIGMDPALKQFGKAHRHLPEIAKYGRVRPVLTTTVGSWARGMMVQADVPDEDISFSILVERFKQAYARYPHVSVHVAESGSNSIGVTKVHGQDVQIWLAEQPYGGTGIAVVYDNLGKGAAGQAVENLKSMLS